MASIKGNIILNGINTVTSILFPIITFPYVSRILMPEGIGIINFQYSIINIITFLTTLGIPTYAIKEIAKNRDDKALRDHIVFEIISLNALMCLLGYVAVFIIASFVPEIQGNAVLFYVLSLSILFTAIGVEWFYKGIEDFKYITVRAIAVRVLSTIFLFVFVRESTDLIAYGLVLVGSTVGNNFINFIHLRTFVSFKSVRFRKLKLLRHIKPALQMFVIGLIINFYGQLNPVMLGFLSDDSAVGFYTAGTKITYIGVMLITSISPVLLPRCSHLLQKGETDAFKKVVEKSLRLTIAFSLPVMVGLAILSSYIVIIFCGSDYLSSVPVLCISTPIVLLIAISNVLGIQILFPQDKTNIVMLSVFVGAVINVVLNILLIPRYAATGAALSTTVAEFGVLLTQIIAGAKYFPFKWSATHSLRYCFSAILMILPIMLVMLLIHDTTWCLIVSIFAGALVYLGSLLKFKDSLTLETLHIIQKKLHLK